MLGPLVVVGPTVGGAEDDRPVLHEDVTACSNLRRSLRRRTGNSGERQGLGHRLDVLKLVLGDHPDEEVVLSKLRKQLENRLADLGHVTARGLRREDRQCATLGTFVREGVVQVVVCRGQRLPPGAALQ